MKIVPNDFVVPELYKSSEFKLKPLIINDVVIDYEIVMSSLDYLCGPKFPFGVLGPNRKWPFKSLTIVDDLIDLAWHQKEFRSRSSFAYKILSPDEFDYLGCIYIFPSEKMEYEVDVYSWIKANRADGSLDDQVFKAVFDWVKKDWPFKKVAYPGRIISWEIWNNLKDK